MSNKLFKIPQNENKVRLLHVLKKGGGGGGEGLVIQ